MKLGTFRAAIAHLPDDAEIRFMNPNFGGPWKGEDLKFTIDGSGRVLIDPPYWKDIDEE